MNVETGTETAQFPEKEYINGISVSVRAALPLKRAAPAPPKHIVTLRPCKHVRAEHGAHGGRGTDDPLTRNTIRLAVTLFPSYFTREGTIGQGT
jgi:hypothetical protein